VRYLNNDLGTKEENSVRPDQQEPILLQGKKGKDPRGEWGVGAAMQIFAHQSLLGQGQKRGGKAESPVPTMGRKKKFGRRNEFLRREQACTKINL